MPCFKSRSRRPASMFSSFPLPHALLDLGEQSIDLERHQKGSRISFLPLNQPVVRDIKFELTSLFLPFPLFGRVSIHLCRFLAAAEHSALCCRSPEVAKHASSEVSSGVQGTTICSVQREALQQVRRDDRSARSRASSLPRLGLTLNFGAIVSQSIA